MQRYDIINSLIDKFNYESYLEIGTQNRSSNFNKINCEFKDCVDPDPEAKADFVMTSDKFFASTMAYYDIIFIDGLHQENQVERDINNSLKFLNVGGTIVIHDCNPQQEIHQLVPRVSKVWNGDTWKAFVKFRQEAIGFFTFTIDSDYGCGIIRRSDKDNPENNKLISSIGMELNWETFENNRKNWLNLISVDKFQEWLKK